MAGPLAGIGQQAFTVGNFQKTGATFADDSKQQQSTSGTANEVSQEQVSPQAAPPIENTEESNAGSFDNNTTAQGPDLQAINQNQDYNGDTARRGSLLDVKA